jgi:predicted nuclease of predicted toxin-antitoxin system
VDLLLDQNLPRNAAALLRGLGHDALHTREIGHQRTLDRDLVPLALAQGRSIATMDKGFSAIIAL